MTCYIKTKTKKPLIFFIYSKFKKKKQINPELSGKPIITERNVGTIFNS